MAAHAHPHLHSAYDGLNAHRAWTAALAALLAAAATVLVIVLSNGFESSSTTEFAPSFAPVNQRFDGGPNEGTRGVLIPLPTLPAGSRFDGGPDEGTRGIPR